MRQIATLPDSAAQKLADYLLTLEIETHLEQEGDATAVWVCDEDRVPQARQELETFQRNPADQCYGQAAAAARRLRRQEERAELEYRQRQKQAEEQVEEAGAPGPRPVTLAVIALTVLVAFSTRLGKPDVVMTQELSISTRPGEWPRLGQVASGEVWRLVTPIFLHFDYLHIIFNVLMFLALAGQIESLRGSGRLLLILLILAIASNLTEFYLGRSSLDGMRLLLRPSVNFGGLSGVVYGLFGYIWVKSRLEPDLGLRMPAQTAVMLMGWFFLCLFVVPNTANAAHVGGLAAGLVLAAISVRRSG